MQLAYTKMQYIPTFLSTHPSFCYF